MVTEIGKFLRILRVSRDESAKKMAERLGVSASYLSAVELGKRAVPASWQELIETEYNLSDTNKEKLKKAIEESTPTVKIDLTEVDAKKKELILSMTKSNLDDETIDKLCEILNSNKKGV